MASLLSGEKRISINKGDKKMEPKVRLLCFEDREGEEFWKC